MKSRRHTVSGMITARAGRGRLGCSEKAVSYQFQREVLAETEEWSVTRNGAGAALKYWKHKSGTPEHVDFRMTSREVWERDYRPHLLQFDRARLDVEGTRKELERRKAQGRWTHYGSLFIWELMRCSMGDICMFESLVLDPEERT